MTAERLRCGSWWVWCGLWVIGLSMRRFATGCVGGVHCSA
jgi:hypothetical protein